MFWLFYPQIREIEEFVMWIKVIRNVNMETGKLGNLKKRSEFLNILRKI